MSALAATHGPIAPVRTVAPALGLMESRRFLLHPVTLVGFAWWTFMIVLGEIQGTFVVQRWETVTSSLSFFPGVLCILAGHMVTTRDRRAGSLEVLGALPGRAEERVVGLCLGAIAPAAVALGLNVAVFAYFGLTDGFAVTPNVWHIVQAPITVLGGCLLGVLLGVWAPSRATPVIGMVSIVAISMWLDGLGASGRLFGPMMSWADWGPYDGTLWYALEPGSPFGHVVYLCGLCGLAASAAVLRVAERRASVLAAGVASLALAVIGGLVQLP
jgi:hypothetical protein